MNTVRVIVRTRVTVSRTALRASESCTSASRQNQRDGAEAEALR
jgi:hypothetical protein